MYGQEHVVQGVLDWGIGVVVKQNEEELLADWIMFQVGTMVLWTLQYHSEDWVSSLSTCTASDSEIP